MTSNDPELNVVTDYGVVLRKPSNYTFFRDPARAFISDGCEEIFMSVSAGGAGGAGAFF